MRITGEKDGDHYYIRAVLVCETHHIVQPLKLMVDSGASVTTVCADRIKDQIDITKLPNGVTMLTANGPASPKLLNDAFLIFATARGKSCAEQLEFVDVQDIPLAPFDGLLGMDVQSRFKVGYGRGRRKITFDK